jgi:hypothetical protein
MIVVLSWYADGSGKPELRFFPDGPSFLREITAHFIETARDGRVLRVYRITDWQRQPDQVFPLPAEEEDT